MVIGGVVGGASAAPSGRGTLSDTTLVARPLGAGRSSCCAASAPELRSERATTTAGAQRMAAPWARVLEMFSGGRPYGGISPLRAVLAMLNPRYSRTGRHEATDHGAHHRGRRPGTLVRVLPSPRVSKQRHCRARVRSWRRRVLRPAKWSQAGGLAA